MRRNIVYFLYHCANILEHEIFSINFDPAEATTGGEWRVQHQYRIANIRELSVRDQGQHAYDLGYRFANEHDHIAPRGIEGRGQGCRSC